MLLLRRVGRRLNFCTELFFSSIYIHFHDACVFNSFPPEKGFLELIKAGKVDCQGETAPVDTSAADAAAKDAAAASEATDDVGGSGVDTTAVVAPVAEIEDVVPEKVEVPEVKDDMQVSNTKIPEPPLGGVNTEIVNIDTKPDLDSGGKEIFDAQV